MGDQLFGLPELRQLLAGRANSEGTPQPIFESLFTNNRILMSSPPPSLAESAPHYEASNFVLPSNYLSKLDHLYSTNITSANTGTRATCNSGSACATVPSHVYGSSSVQSNRGALCGMEMENFWNDIGFGTTGGGSFGAVNTSRWPRQETLTLLEIRSRLDPSFKEANQKAPLWDEVSRIMAEEYGYNRSGRKCREKFENLYKYYKKTKEGKSGRQDGKRYRFFRQLEAIYGEGAHSSSTFQPYLTAQNEALMMYRCPTNNEEMAVDNKQGMTESFSFSTTSEFEVSSSENNDDDLLAIACLKNRSDEKQKRVSHESRSDGRVYKRSWKTKVKDYVDTKMKKMVEAQDFWMERLMKIVEDKELERMCRQEEWMKKEEDRLDREHEMWTKERAWMETRDAEFIEALKKNGGRGLLKQLPISLENMAIGAHRRHQEMSYPRWTETEMLSLMELRTAMEPKFQGSDGNPNEGLWEEISAKMAGSGYHRTMDECHQKWDTMKLYFSAHSESKREMDSGFWDMQPSS